MENKSFNYDISHENIMKSTIFLEESPMQYIVSMWPVPTKWATSRKISFPSYNQIHVVQTRSFKMTYYMLWLLPYLGSKTFYFLEKFLYFLLFFEMFSESYLFQIPGDLSLILWEQVSYTCKSLPIENIQVRKKQICQFWFVFPLHRFRLKTRSSLMHIDYNVKHTRSH